MRLCAPKEPSRGRNPTHLFARYLCKMNRILKFSSKFLVLTLNYTQSIFMYVRDSKSTCMVGLILLKHRQKPRSNKLKKNIRKLKIYHDWFRCGGSRSSEDIFPSSCFTGSLCRKYDGLQLSKTWLTILGKKVIFAKSSPKKISQEHSIWLS